MMNYTETAAADRFTRLVLTCFDDGPLPAQQRIRSWKFSPRKCVTGDLLYRPACMAQNFPDGVRKVRDAGHTSAPTPRIIRGLDNLSIERPGRNRRRNRGGDGSARRWVAGSRPFFRPPGLPALAHPGG